MDEKYSLLLLEEEKDALGVLQDNGWIFLADISIEKATPEGEKWPSYLMEGLYPMGMIRLPVKIPVAASPPVKKKKPGRKKKADV